MAGDEIIRQQRRRGAAGPPPVALTLVAIFIIRGFGYETVGSRLTTVLDGVVIARQEIPRTPYAHGTGMIYTVRSADGVDHSYVAGATDGSLPRDIPVGAQITKRKWELSYLSDGRRVDDFPRTFYGIILGVACGCLLWGGLQWWRGRHA
jgi:hypothetical protein